MEYENIKLSVIIPVYNRPLEVDELLKSLSKQSESNFEIIVIEDGSTVKCDTILGKYLPDLNLKYFFKTNSGPGLSRNYGYEKATGNYFIFLDSDCVLPAHYIASIKNSLANDYCDAFGGPDKAHRHFTNFQKAINYAMTSFLTTGGIRGSSIAFDRFYPRSFNMGFSKNVFEKTNGFSGMRYGEDIDLSTRIYRNEFKIRLIEDAYVYHKRRTNFRQFFYQIYNSGYARIILMIRHPNYLRIVYTLPAIFTIVILLLFLFSIIVSAYLLAPVFLFSVLVFFDAAIRNKSIIIGIWSILTSFTLLAAYGSGFIIAFWKHFIFGKMKYSEFTDNVSV